MPKNDVGGPKWLANKMKSKGLQKLRWFCQMCEKQCRDENGFKCHVRYKHYIVADHVADHAADLVAAHFADHVPPHDVHAPPALRQIILIMLILSHYNLPIPIFA